MSNESDDLALAVLRKALQATGSSSWRLAAAPCCEAAARVETSPGDATTLVGWTCPAHGLTVRGKHATDGLAYRTARADWIRRAREFLGQAIETGPMIATGVVAGTSYRAPDEVGVVEFGPPVPAGDSFGLHVVDPSPAKDAAKPEHPAPWTWDRETEYGTANARSAVRLNDATDSPVAWVTMRDTIGIASPLARELIRLAPNMADLLRKHEWAGERGDVGEYCVECDGIKPVAGQDLGDLLKYGRQVGHRTGCALAAILAALDAARAVKP